MPSTNNDTYNYIINKISSIKDQYPSLRNKTNDYVFNALAVKSMFYKNPANEVTENDFDDIIVDSHADGGVDILLTDPNSETDDLIIGQSKLYKTISLEECSNAINKMADFYLDLSQGHYENVNEMVGQRFSWLNGNVGDESKIKFVLFTSAPKNNIRFDRLQKTLYNKLADQSKFELIVLFDTDIKDEIKDAESRRPSIDSGEIDIDVTSNWLEYEDMAAIVNVSAFSIKELYVKHGNNLLARNLRYHVSGANVDRAIEDSINNKPELFWLKNNGITIICDDFKLDGKKVKLTNFSIVNGGQTTYKIRKNKNISKDYDFYLPCKIVKVQGKDEDEKSNFSLEIAKATNSQKAIKNSDLKANAPEQVRFSQAMRDVGIFYQTKRGENIPTAYKDRELHSDITQIGKLCLSGIFQMPCSSRNKPSTIYADRYYNDIFNGNQQKVAKLCKELLYIDYYFDNIFKKQYLKELSESTDADIKKQFASNARTVCTAFVVLASRYYQNNFKIADLEIMFTAARNDKLSDNTDVYNIVKNIEGISWILPPEIFENKDKYDEILYKLFSLIILYGSHDLMLLSNTSSESVVASNYLKKDKNYIDIIRRNWDFIEKEIKDIFNGLPNK